MAMRFFLPAMVLGALIPPYSVVSAQSGVAQPGAAGASPTIKTNANLVLLDVVVTNRGEPVHGLGQGHFKVLQDGREQAIVSFEEHRGGAEPAGAKGLNLPAGTWTNQPLYPASAAVNVVLLDALNTPLASQMQVRQRMVGYLGKLKPGTPVAVFTLSSRLRMIAGFTSDPAELVKTLKSGKATPQASPLLDTATGNDMDSIVGDMATFGADSEAVGGLQQFLADYQAFQTDARVRMTLNAMQQLGRYLNAIPGRKNLIWFSGSFPIELAPDGTLEDPFQAFRSYAEDIEETADLLFAARVVVYPIDSRGLLVPPSANVTTTASTNLVTGMSNGGRGGKRQMLTANKPSAANSDAKFEQEEMAEAASMEEIAEATGGKYYINTNGFEQAVADAIDNGGSYYTIGYVPDPRKLDGRYHKIDVRMDFEGDKLAYRRGYFAETGDGPGGHGLRNVSLITAATLHGAPPSTEVVFQARVAGANDPQLAGTKVPMDGAAGEMSAELKGPLHREIVDLKVDPRGISFAEAAGDVHAAQVEFVLVAYDGEGRKVNYVDKGFQMNLRREVYERTMAGGLPMRLAIDLPDGQYWLRIAVHDLVAGRVGSLEVPVKVAQ